MTVTLMDEPGMLSRLLRTREYQLPSFRRLRDLPIPPSVIHLVPESVARENTMLPVDFDGETLTCVTDQADDVMLEDKIRFVLNCNVRFIGCDRQTVQSGINHYYGVSSGESADSMLQEFTDMAIDFTETERSDDEKLVAECSADADAESIEKIVYLRDPYATCRDDRSPFQSPKDPGAGFMFYTIAEGQRVVARRRNGRLDVIVGPRRVLNWRTRFEKMRHHVAHPGQYLTLRFRDGREAVKVGPTEMWLDPREHESIEVQECLDLAAKEAVVVYHTNHENDSGHENESFDDLEAGSTTKRRIFYGPGQFAPQPGEWLHRFSWHASHGGSRGEEKRPNALQFQKLALMPDQMYHDVRDVRTADDAVLTIRLMIFFELIDIERMLETTHDPIGDFINAATSDVVEFTGKRSFDQFKQETDKLNDSTTYTQLLHRAKQCGYRVNNVVYRGYGAPDSLQAMHDEAIQSRTRLRLERATEEQAQDVEDYRLSCQVERSERRRREQLTEVQHDLEVKRQQAEAEIKQKERQEDYRREQIRAANQLSLQQRQATDQQTQAHLSALREMEVDLTQYLTQARADQVIEVRGSSDVQPELHFANTQPSV
jgi:regulator of protease activity HflC (stomatin/prohibitin superfamily)